MNIIHDLPPSFPDNTFVALDTEIFGMNEKQMHRPTNGTFACLTACADPETVYITQDEKDVPKFLERLDNCIWVGHNIKFDMTHWRRWANVPKRNKVIDTMLIDRILWNGYYDRFSEEFLARRYLDVAMDKSLQKAFVTATEMTPAMIEYACTDPSYDLRIWNEQKKHLTKTDMKIWKEIDMPTLWAVLDFQGFRLDVDKWKALAERNLAKSEELKAQLPYSPFANAKMISFYDKNGFKKIPNNQAETLETFINKYPKSKAAEVAKIALECKDYAGWASKFGMDFINDYLEKESDDVSFILCNYWITGAETGRMSASDPAMHQIPVRETKEFRDCFIARPGNKLVIPDWCSQEIGIQAYLAQDIRMMEIFNSGQDIYIRSAKDMLDKTIEKSDPLRNTMKAVVLGSDYDMSEYGLSRKLKVSLDDAKELLNKFRKTFPQMYEYQERQREKRKVVQTIDGRKFHLNPYSDQCPRNAINAPTQGTAGDMLKRSIATVHKEWNFDYRFGIVEVTHDEMGLDVPENIAPDVAKFTERIMIDTANTLCPGMKFRCDVHVCNTWAEAK